MSTPEPSEITVEKVARAIEGAEEAHGPFYFPCQCGWEAGFGVGWEERGDRHRLLSLAAAAIAAVPASPAEAAVKRVEALCDAQGDDSYVMTYALRAAIAAPQTGEHTTDEETDRG